MANLATKEVRDHLPVLLVAQPSWTSPQVDCDTLAQHLGTEGTNANRSQRKDMCLV